MLPNNALQLSLLGVLVAADQPIPSPHELGLPLSPVADVCNRAGALVEGGSSPAAITRSTSPEEV